MGRGGGGAVPKDWVGCPKIAEDLIDKIFLVFKTPLDLSINAKVDPESRFGLSDIFKHIQDLQKTDVLWIDLTNTDRYYPRKLIQDRKGFTYLKMPIEGHGLPPSPVNRETFCSAVDSFLKDKPEGIIGVHCTHGFNRTGYLICNYLIHSGRLDVHKSIAEFSRARPPGIYRQNYVDHLYEVWEAKAQEENPSAELPARIQITSPQWENASSKATPTKHFKSESIKPWAKRALLPTPERGFRGGRYNSNQRMNNNYNGSNSARPSYQHHYNPYLSPTFTQPQQQYQYGNRNVGGSGNDNDQVRGRNRVSRWSSPSPSPYYRPHQGSTASESNNNWRNQCSRPTYTYNSEFQEDNFFNPPPQGFLPQYPPQPFHDLQFGSPFSIPQPQLLPHPYQGAVMPAAQNIGDATTSTNNLMYYNNGV